MRRYADILGGGRTVLPDHFNQRIDMVRRRFASSLESKISDTYAELPQLSDAGAKAVDIVANAYRRIHAIRGIGGTVGFPETGRAAKDVEDVLVSAYRDQRALEIAEIARVRDTLDVLGATAQAELHATSRSSASNIEA
jgi:chemotaxis protein histidine kinase CheA